MRITCKEEIKVGLRVIREEVAGNEQAEKKEETGTGDK